MKLFFVLLLCLVTVAFLTWMTVSLGKIQEHRDNMKRAKELSQQHS